MNKHLTLLLRCFGLSRPRPKTRLQRILRHAERTLAALLLLYLGLLLFPQVMFAHSVSAHGITIYSRAPLPPEATECAERTATLLSHSELAVPGRRERVFVCDSPWLFRLFNPAGTPFAISYPVTDHVFVAAADFRKNVARRYAPDFNTRSLSGVMAHEISHGLIRHRLGLLRSKRLPDWVNEGYCEYLVQESSFPEAEGLPLMASGQNHPSPAYRYFTYRQMVRYLMEGRGLSFADVVARAGDSPTVQSEARAWLQTQNERLQ